MAKRLRLDLDEEEDLFSEEEEDDQEEIEDSEDDDSEEDEDEDGDEAPRLKRITPMKAIRAKCLDCCAGQTKEVRICGIRNCSLWPFRMGKRPSSRKAQEANEEAKAFRNR
jgi:hypothetical protein